MARKKNKEVSMIDIILWTRDFVEELCRLAEEGVAAWNKFWDALPENVKKEIESKKA